MSTRKYQKHTLHKHILELPDTYVGSTKTNEETRWVYNPETNKITWRKVNFNPGLYKIFDEIIVNARDEYIRSITTAEMTPIKHIDINVSSADGDTTISVENDGDGITIEEDPDEKVMIPQMIFGELLTSSNYNKDEEKIVGGKNGYGSKCIRFDTKVLLWSSKIKKADEIKKGDILIGDDGTPRKVLNIIRGHGKMYKVCQAHGESYTVNDEHILTLHMPDHKVIFWDNTNNKWSVLWWDNKLKKINKKSIICSPAPKITCPECGIQLHSNLKRHYSRNHHDKEVPKVERKSATKVPQESMESLIARKELEEFCSFIPDDNVFDISIKDYMALNETTKKRLAGVRGKCVNWPHQSVYLDPYILGIWLGDGDQTGYNYTCYGEKDPQIINYLEEWGKSNDAIIKQKDKYHYSISSKDNKGKTGYAPLKKLLNKYGLVNNKHIPREYLMNDRETRLAVLAGIIDTDGHVSRNGTRITISQGLNHEQLANDIVYLARSLGFACHMIIRNTTWTWKDEKKEGLAYLINISGKGLEDIPTLLPRKKCASTIDKNTSKSTGFLTITDVGDDDYVGFSITGNERFLINDFTVTHNCTNILSKTFTVDIKNPSTAKSYTQTWTNNMYDCGKPSIKKLTSNKGSVKITFIPDSKLFNGAFDETGIINDMISVFHTRVIELAGLVGNSVKVSWNGTTVSSNTFEKYIKLFLRDGMSGFAYENCGPRWEVGAILTRHLYSDDEELPDDNKHISFVNGINTKKGGKHVETVSRKVLDDFCEIAKKKKVDIKPGQLKNAIILFINATIVNPSFDSQSKETLTTPSKEFGSRPEFNGKIVDSLVKLGLLDEAKYILEAKTLRDAKKTDGKKRTVIRGMSKLVDASLAGSSKSKECTLILTEGDSAATAAISGLNVVGREKWGVFPLRGKLLNVRDITIQKFNANEELTAIKKILGLEQGKTYNSLSDLRYGRVMIMADQDHDGSHIKGLLMNLFHAEWPSLLKTGFLCTLLTPILKASKGKSVLPFYSIPEFNAWKDKNSLSGWKIKYYKGLGTSTPNEAREWFKDLHEIKYEWDDITDESINLAFNKKFADDRKKWLSHYDPTKMLIPSDGKASYTSFINNELIHFSNADNIRSLPHLIDGLKPSQRKILYCCLKRNLKEEIRVAQLAGYVSEHAAYHHGEASLNSTIVGMAQNFVGANNINMLYPAGGFGSRLQGGKDSASPRYIHTYLENIVDKLFKKEDNPLLKYQNDDGQLVEPEYYLPVVPLLAINGSVGIGTGYSTDIPPHNPDDIICLLRHRLTGSIDTLENRPLDPWWFGFKGDIIRTNESTWVTKGLYEFNDSNHSITITELPVGKWTNDYKTFLDEMCEAENKKSKEVKREAKKAENGSKSSKGSKDTKVDYEPCGIKDFDDLYTDNVVKFTVYFNEEGYDEFKENKEKFEKRFKLTTSWKTTNMTCFDTDFNITKYNTIGDILEAFVEKRLPMYEERRQSNLRILHKQIEELDAKRRFIQAILDGKLELQRKSDDEIVEGLKSCNIPPLNCPDKPDEYDSYDYVTRMRIDRVKQSAVIEMDKQISEKQGEISHLEAESAESLWLADLDEFEEAWKVYITKRSEYMDNAGTSLDSKDSSKKVSSGGRKKKPAISK